MINSGFDGSFIGTFDRAGVEINGSIFVGVATQNSNDDFIFGHFLLSGEINKSPQIIIPLTPVSPPVP
ncbi:MAG: hypothetical protein MK105_13440, partial [Crocinitomicaceae bacterium]|nr:hypothetical protein [Crocinitomicaceae bacterium]